MRLPKLDSNATAPPPLLPPPLLVVLRELRALRGAAGVLGLLMLLLPLLLPPRGLVPPLPLCISRRSPSLLRPLLLLPWLLEPPLLLVRSSPPPGCCPCGWDQGHCQVPPASPPAAMGAAALGEAAASGVGAAAGTGAWGTAAALASALAAGMLPSASAAVLPPPGSYRRAMALMRSTTCLKLGRWSGSREVQASIMSCSPASTSRSTGPVVVGSAQEESSEAMY
jgi:hypothetical protein